jgi:hypothetical protein
MIKNYLRIIMAEERLGGITVSSIEKDLASNLDYSYFIPQFAAG